MVYKVLIVDDEPIILSGIKSILDWEKHGVTIQGTARNGDEAYEFIVRNHPDIVITDINMPMMDGISLLKKCNETYPEIVFIILSALEEFRLAKEALSFRAVDYLLKIELDEHMMAESIAKAKRECERRSIMYKMDSSAEADDGKIEQYVYNLLKFRDTMADRRMTLGSAGLLDNYAFLSVILPVDHSAMEDDFDEDMEKRYSWEREIAEKIISPFFPRSMPVMPISTRNTYLVYFLSDFSPLSWSRNITQVRERIISASKMVLNQDVSVIHSKAYQGPDHLEEARDDLEMKVARFYMCKDDVEIEELHLDNTLRKIERSLRTKDKEAFEVVMNLIEERIQHTDHRRSQAVFFLEAMSYAIRSGFKGMDLENEGLRISDAMMNSSLYITTHHHTEKILSDARADILSLLTSRSSHNEIISKAKTYVLSHLEKQLTLAEIAENAFVSPGYLSALFKKTTGTSLVDYVNNCKIDRARELIANGTRRVDEMARAVGFENIYYFSKVFKKITGLPPTEYVRKIDSTRS